jgi:hypothetical protein
MAAKMKSMIGIIAILLILGIGLGVSQIQSDVKPSWVHKVQWSDKVDDSSKIERLLWTEITTYRTEYEMVNISASQEGKDLHLKVIATAEDTDRPDIYDFVYDGKELLLTGYLLEAIPSYHRNEAIVIALGNQEVAASSASAGTPTVRRILPETSEKFYAPKILLSVTWGEVSALIDPDEGKVVQIWRPGLQQGNKK